MGFQLVNNLAELNVPRAEGAEGPLAATTRGVLQMDVDHFIEDAVNICHRIDRIVVKNRVTRVIVDPDSLVIDRFEQPSSGRSRVRQPLVDLEREANLVLLGIVTQESSEIADPGPGSWTSGLRSRGVDYHV